MGLFKRKQEQPVSDETRGQLDEVNIRLDAVEKRLKLLEQTVKVYRREA